VEHLEASIRLRSAHEKGLARAILRLSLADRCIFIADIAAVCRLFAADISLFRAVSATVIPPKSGHLQRLADRGELGSGAGRGAASI
jgi:hypothetical protein